MKMLNVNFQMLMSATLLSALLISCGRSQNPTGGSDFQAASALDLSSENLSPGGCLNLEIVAKQLQSLPGGAQVRYHTKNFEMSAATSEGTAVRRNFTAIAALAHFSFEQISSRQFVGELPAIKQTGCDAVEMTSEIEGARIYKVERPLANGELKLMMMQKDPQSPDLLIETGHELTYSMKSPRQLEITMTSVSIDPCPSYAKAKGTGVQEIYWGTADELATTPIQISRKYVGLISVAVDFMPRNLMDLVSRNTDETVFPAAADLKDLKRSSPAADISKCPYRTSPPSGTEPPPPPAEDTPAPQPTPVPLPGPGPSPGLPQPPMAPTPLPN